MKRYSETIVLRVFIAISFASALLYWITDNNTFAIWATGLAGIGLAIENIITRKKADLIMAVFAFIVTAIIFCIEKGLIN
ncbi:MAG: hypothetical protein ACLU8F_06450 [Clostridia bacterium]